MKKRLSTKQRRDLRAIVMDGGFFSGMVGTGESYIPAFALAVGLGDVVSGLIATVPMLAGALLQLATPFAVARLGSYRRWVVGCACLQAASFVPLVVGGLRGDLSLGWVVAATVGYWGFGMATGPAWNAWITSLVPEAVRARFFAHRTRVAQGSLVAALLGAGLLLELGRRLEHELLFFALIFAAALVLRLLSASQLHRQSEEDGLAARHAAITPARAAPAFAKRGTRRMLAYLIAMMAATNIAAPFFTPYMLGPLGLSYGRFMTLTAVAFVARLLVLPYLGRLVERRGPRFALTLGAVAIVPIPPLWLVSDHFVYLIGVQMLAGFAWAAVELSTLLAIFESVEDAARTRVLSIFNLLNAAAIAGGALLGSWVFLRLEADLPAYGALFVISSIARLLVLPLLWGMRSERPLHAEEFHMRTVAVRPSAGAVQRPILPTLEHTEPEEEPREPGEGPRDA